MDVGFYYIITAISSARVFDLLYFKSPLTKVFKNGNVQLLAFIFTQHAYTRMSVTSITSVHRRINVNDVISMRVVECERSLLFLCDNLL